jgi:small-conductance mechanosensitive channel
VETDPNAFSIVGGIFNLGFAVLHLSFWKLFHWKEDLASLTHTKRSVMQILNLCLIFVFLLFAYISFVYPAELLTNGLGKFLLIGIALFWFLRLIEQVVFFGVRNKFSVASTGLFFVGGLLYLLPAIAGG